MRNRREELRGSNREKGIFLSYLDFYPKEILDDEPTEKTFTELGILIYEPSTGKKAFISTLGEEGREKLSEEEEEINLEFVESYLELIKEEVENAPKEHFSLKAYMDIFVNNFRFSEPLIFEDEVMTFEDYARLNWAGGNQLELEMEGKKRESKMDTVLVTTLVLTPLAISCYFFTNGIMTFENSLAILGAIFLGSLSGAGLSAFISFLVGKKKRRKRRKEKGER